MQLGSLQCLGAARPKWLGGNSDEGVCNYVSARGGFSILGSRHGCLSRHFLGGDTTHTNLVRFWANMAKTEWFEATGFKGQILEDPERFIPLRLFGDDVAVTKNISLECVNVASVFSSALPAMLAKIISLTIPLGEITKDGLFMLYDILRWSIAVMLDGHWPEKDPFGQHWPRRSYRAVKGASRDPLASGYRFVVCEILGDWKWVRECLSMPYWYGKKACCHTCRALKVLGTDVSFVDFRSKIPLRTHAEYIGHFDEAPPFARLPGFHISMVRGEYMHLVCLGVGHVVVASMFLELCQEGMFGHRFVGRKLIRYNLQLRYAYLKFTAWAKSNRRSHSQRMFSLALLSLGTSMKRIPIFKGKAANTMVVLQWLESLVSCKEQQTSRHQKLRALTVISLCRQWRLCHVRSLWFTTLQARSFARDVRRFLFASKLLFWRSRRLNKRTWCLKPKHHQLMHLGELVQRTRRFPASHWCFSDERFVGGMKRVLPNLRPGRKKASLRLLQRHYIGIRLRLHGRLSDSLHQRAAML